MTSTPLHFFTICARNYASSAATLVESIRKQHPTARVTVWLLQEGEVPACLADIEVRDLSDVLPEATYTIMRVRYNIVEFCTAVKPRVFMKMFEEGDQRIIYIDPDIYLYRPLEEVERLLDEGNAGVLTAHSLSPIPDDGLGTDDYVLLMSGVFNLGFIALRQCAKTQEFLVWWWRWLQTHASEDHTTGLFTDQKWMGLAPAFWPELVLTRHLGYNVAFWNLHERPLAELPDGTITAGGAPLVFYHFSGYSPHAPDKLAKYDHQKRFNPTEGSVLRKLCDAYAARLLSNGFEETRKIVVKRDGLDGRIDKVALQFLPSMVEDGRMPAYENLLARLHGYDEGKSYPRYVEAVLDLRPGVRKMYKGKNLAHLVRWMRDYAIKEQGLSSEIVESFVMDDYAKLLRTPKSTAPIAILGMHRSNTSMVAQMMSRLGVFLGPTSSFADSSGDNQDGYWEDQRFHRISVEILQRFGGAWDQVSILPDGWVDDPRLEDLAKELSLLAEGNANHIPWGWKDPRACITLPFFAKHLKDMRLVVTVRHPVEVAFSLVYRKYDNVPYEVGLHLWFQHYQALLPFLEHFPSIIVHSQSLRSQPIAELGRISEFLGLGVSSMEIAAAAGTVRPELRRSVPIDFKKLEADLPPHVSRLYAELLKLSGPLFQPAEDEMPFSTVESAQLRIRQLESVVAEKSADITGARRHLHHLMAEIQAKDQVIQQKETQLLQRSDESSLRPGAESARDGSPYEDQLASLEQENRRLQREVNAYSNLRAVRLTSRLRNFLSKIRRG